MVYRFKCGKCDQWHEGLPEISYGEPFYVAEILEAERSKRLFLTPDLCVIDDKHFFVRCRLPLTVAETGEDWGWGVWSTLSESNFLRYQEQFDQDMSDWEPMFGWLSNRLPDYPDTLSLKLSVQPRRKGSRPLVTLEPTDHPLAIEQRDGIALERVLQFTEPFREHD